MFAEKLDALSQMMAAHMTMPFLPGFRGLECSRRVLAAEVETLREKLSSDQKGSPGPR